MSAQLESGLYIITNKSTKNQIGRYFLEDMSFNPKRIVTLGGEVMSPSNRPWEIERHGKYHRIKALGAPVGEIDGLLWAHLAEGVAVADWQITPCPHHGSNVYIVHKPCDTVGWVAGGKEESQILVRPLVPTGSNPPYFQDQELFMITPAYQYGSLGI